MSEHTDTFDAATGAPLRSVIGWERIKLQYATNTMSVRELAAEHGVSHTLINRKVKKDGWARDLSVRVSLAANAKVARQAARKAAQERFTPARAPWASPQLSEPASERAARAPAISEVDIIDSEAAIQAHVRMAHRKSISRVRVLSTVMLAELEASVIDADLLEQFGELMRAPDDKGQDKLNDLYHKVISLPGRVDTMKKLAESMKIMIGLEREAHGIDTLSGSDDANPLVALVKAMRRSTLPIVHQVENDDAL